ARPSHAASRGFEDRRASEDDDRLSQEAPLDQTGDVRIELTVGDNRPPRLRTHRDVFAVASGRLLAAPGAVQDPQDRTVAGSPLASASISERGTAPLPAEGLFFARESMWH